MKDRLLTSLGVAIAVGATGFLTVAPAAGEAASDTWTAPRTADGYPDLQGVWANNNATPLERPEAWAGKETLSPEEVAELQAASPGTCRAKRSAIANGKPGGGGGGVRPLAAMSNTFAWFCSGQR